MARQVTHGQRDRVLPAAKESLRAVDRIERPVPSAWRCAPTIDRGERLVDLDVRFQASNEVDHPRLKAVSRHAS